MDNDETTYDGLRRVAEIQDRTLTDFVVSSTREAARRTIKEAAMLRLSAQDQKHLTDALLHPPAPNPALKHAARRRRELFGA